MAKKNRPLESFMFYSLRSLPLEQRRELQRFKNPRNDQASLQRLKDAGVILYRDNVNYQGILIPQPALAHVWTAQGFQVDNPFEAYVYQATASEKGSMIEVKERLLPKAYSIELLNLHNARIEKYGDSLWWDRWAKPCSVRSMTPFSVVSR